MKSMMRSAYRNKDEDDCSSHPASYKWNTHIYFTELPEKQRIAVPTDEFAIGWCKWAKNPLNTNIPSHLLDELIEVYKHNARGFTTKFKQEMKQHFDVDVSTYSKKYNGVAKSCYRLDLLPKDLKVDNAVSQLATQVEFDTVLAEEVKEKDSRIALLEARVEALEEYKKKHWNDEKMADYRANLIRRDHCILKSEISTFERFEEAITPLIKTIQDNGGYGLPTNKQQRRKVVEAITVFSRCLKPVIPLFRRMLKFRKAIREEENEEPFIERKSVSTQTEDMGSEQYDIYETESSESSESEQSEEIKMEVKKVKAKPVVKKAKAKYDDDIVFTKEMSDAMREDLEEYERQEKKRWEEQRLKDAENQRKIDEMNRRARERTKQWNNEHD